ncbi:hypothetical protein TKK_0003179 [Trichogramma kaykai]
MAEFDLKYFLKFSCTKLQGRFESTLQTIRNKASKSGVDETDIVKFGALTTFVQNLYQQYVQLDEKNMKSRRILEEQIKRFINRAAYKNWANRTLDPFLDALRFLVIFSQLNLTCKKHSHTLDLHYFKKNEAKIVLTNFLSSHKNSEVIQVVTGWGNGSKDHISVLQTLAKKIIENSGRNVREKLDARLGAILLRHLLKKFEEICWVTIVGNQTNKGLYQLCLATAGKSS